MTKRLCRLLLFLMRQAYTQLVFLILLYLEIIICKIIIVCGRANVRTIRIIFKRRFEGYFFAFDPALVSMLLFYLCSCQSVVFNNDKK